jgi:Trk K+ transport system NAD-binding subunit
LAGLGNYGSGIAEHLLRRNKSVLGVDFDPSALEKWRKRGVPVIYGDVADQDMHSQLSLKKAQWFISAVRSKDINLALMQHLKKEGYGGKVALTAVNEDEVRAYEKAGANVILRPFTDATEQAADALTDAMDFLPDIPDWPISFIEVRIRSDALAAGRTIKDLPLRSMTGVSVLAVSRGGKVYYDPETDFRIYPGDRLLIMGHPDGLTDAEKVLNELDTKWDGKDSDRFEAGEIRVADNSTLSGRSLEELQFRRKYGVTLVGIRRGTEQITVVNPTERLMGGDCLIVVGVSGAVRTLKEREPL